MILLNSDSRWRRGRTLYSMSKNFTLFRRAVKLTSLPESPDLFPRGDCVGVVRRKSLPSEIWRNSRAMVDPLML
jgi:hypothetical protein